MRHTHPVGTFLLSLILMALDAGPATAQAGRIGSPFPVEIVSPDPLRVEVVNPPANPGLTPHRVQVKLLFGAGSGTGSVAFPAIPVGQRFVVEYVTVLAQLPTGQELLAVIAGDNSLDSDNVLVDVAFQPKTVTGVSVDSHVASLPVRLYVEPGTSPFLIAARSANTQTGLVRAVLSGHLVTLP